ncbi:MAG TPA: hypothetical protein VMT32_17505 [Bryobacteraceae bacterium]|nr:hypothetical protein [Bryobacteraceae bacterium]
MFITERPLFSAKSPSLAVVEWLMVLPAGLFLAAAVLRGLQPRQYEPARTSWIIVEWFGGMPHSVLALLLIGLPTIAVAVGGATVYRIWRRDPVFREDLAAAFAVLRRQLLPCLLITATLLAGSILTLVVSHLVTD